MGPNGQNGGARLSFNGMNTGPADCGWAYSFKTTKIAIIVFMVMIRAIMIGLLEIRS